MHLNSCFLVLNLNDALKCVGKGHHSLLDVSDSANEMAECNLRANPGTSNILLLPVNGAKQGNLRLFKMLLFKT